jgi:hypothetical protein
LSCLINMNIKKATEEYEAWLSRHTPLVEDDLTFKHQQMAKGVFPFLRATYYRWAQVWPAVCPELAGAPGVLAVGDLHIENFGTWRDTEGRLVWGVNDFDEASRIPYTNDLARLAVSARLAVDSSHLKIDYKDVDDAILTGYVEWLERGGEPLILAEKRAWLREIATSILRDPVKFWKKIEQMPTASEPVPAEAEEALKALLPEPDLPYRLCRRRAGLGSLGRQRYVAVAAWRGGSIAREAKALAPSAYHWAKGEGAETSDCQLALDSAVRCADPFVRQRDGWMVRRLAPDCSKIETEQFPRLHDDYRLLRAMGKEVANVHLGSEGAADSILQDLKDRPKGWLQTAAKEMARAVGRDWADWKKGR